MALVVDREALAGLGGRLGKTRPPGSLAGILGAFVVGTWRGTPGFAEVCRSQESDQEDASH